MSKQQQPKAKITSHILDLSRGKPASNIYAKLYKRDEINKEEWQLIGNDVSNEDGRITQLLKNESMSIEVGVYKIIFESGLYYKQQSLDTFYPEISIVFNIANPIQHYHVPLLLNQFGFSTYRGS